MYDAFQVIKLPGTKLSCGSMSDDEAETTDVIKDIPAQLKVRC